MTGWNLPPGCTPADIDRAAGALVRCSVCGREFEPSAEQEEAFEETEEWVCNRQMCQDPDYLHDLKRDEG
jgi:hypothetical protein